jgi:DNA polymerase I-like protein with 3'-5' exonuclease and polymerase domains
MRAAANHEIQSPGGQITKTVQRAIWDIQPAGVYELKLGLLNVHDELMWVTHPSVVKQVTETVRRIVESYRSAVPLIGMCWYEEMANWAEKKDGAQKVKIRAPEMM